jgi:hypothetical protein
LVIAVVALALSAAMARAQNDACRAQCEQWGAPCIQACANAPVVEDCKANCRKMYQQCLSDCTGSSKGEHDGAYGAVRPACERRAM